MAFRQLAYLPDRRSTRTDRSVHITVRGLDASRAPYQEKASTLVVNCHGCRYLSRNSVLRGDTATLEVIPSRADRPQLTTQVRVVSVKPIGDEMLFDIAVELESPQNIWGIASAPEDWSQFCTAGQPPSAPRENRILPWPEVARTEAGTEAAKAETPKAPESVPAPAELAQPSLSTDAVATSQLPPLLAHVIDSLREQVGAPAPASEMGRAAVNAKRAAEDHSESLREYCAYVEIEVTKAVESLFTAVSKDLARGARRLRETNEVGAHDSGAPWVRQFEQQLAKANRRLA